MKRPTLYILLDLFFSEFCVSYRLDTARFIEYFPAIASSTVTSCLFRPWWRFNQLVLLACHFRYRPVSMLIYIEMRFEWRCQTDIVSRRCNRRRQTNWVGNVLSVRLVVAFNSADNVWKWYEIEPRSNAESRTINWNDNWSAYRKNAVIAFICNVNLVQSYLHTPVGSININTIYTRSTLVFHASHSRWSNLAAG